jgi:hypothetical protein
MPPEPNSQIPGTATAQRRTGADLVHVISAWLARADRRLDRLDFVNVNDGLLAVAADAVHGVAIYK